MSGSTAERLNSVAVVGAYCGDIAIGAGATLIQISRTYPNVVVHGLVLTGGGTLGEIEERNAFAAMCPSADVGLTVLDLPNAMLECDSQRGAATIAAFGNSCQPDLVLAPRRDGSRRLLAQFVATQFHDRLVLSYEIPLGNSGLPTPTVYLPVPTEVALRKADMLRECYPSQRGPFEDGIVLGLMQVRGVQCRSRYAEGFAVEQAAIAVEDLYSPN